MLIINADDFGRSREATDSALSCYQHGRISSTTAMVFMEDSERAAQAALDCGVEVGLHLNFSEAFSAAAVPSQLTEAHRKVRRFLGRNKYALILYHPFLRKEFAFLFHAQCEEFMRLYGRSPSHIDGHQHMHLATNLLVDEVIPNGAKVRRNFSFGPGERNIFQLTYRRWVDACLARRYELTDYFFALDDYLAPERFSSVIGLSEMHSVEVMTHPQLSKDYEALMSQAFAGLLQPLRLATYTDL